MLPRVLVSYPQSSGRGNREDLPIPPLNDDGLLPVGIYECTLDEIGETFGAFKVTDRRVRLFEALQKYASEAFATGLVAEIVVDGSFVTAKDSPGDVDLVIVLVAGVDLATREFSPAEYNVVSKRRARARCGFDVFVVVDRTERHETSVTYFTQLKGHPGVFKGLLRVRP